MSETSQGPGWRRASDGKWYPPQPTRPSPPLSVNTPAFPMAPPPGTPEVIPTAPPGTAPNPTPPLGTPPGPAASDGGVSRLRLYYGLSALAVVIITVIIIAATSSK
jgi:hypothetical protein